MKEVHNKAKITNKNNDSGSLPQTVVHSPPRTSTQMALRTNDNNEKNKKKTNNKGQASKGRTGHPADINKWENS